MNLMEKQSLFTFNKPREGSKTTEIICKIYLNETCDIIRISTQLRTTKTEKTPPVPQWMLKK